ncbi:fused PTS fructose transporter subunit IIA/HPr protein [Vibrio sp. Isolate23]|uniref:fused PTS fructose transporter subunit IIA/HPr protein n=1 Tax=Vibrio sp. Isolate23 TaxID=2908533 RepID=UPI001EFC3CC7|nr:fused PTS fructose transporter subunit IIA/HPr protein [Vibrio sp. Isolate23]MCG9685019.1 fused PTS fructose transporter subunit IIA/HPr protein [Vibrio sp. Isolate23]
MLKLTKHDIALQQSFSDKKSAISFLAESLTNKGLVDNGYVEGMLNRENQNSTFLGNGIAIPHGTTDTRSLVKTTGVTIAHFPQGVDWGDGNTAYVAIGIAAKSDEHLGILKQLTKVLSADGIEEKIKHAKSEEEIIALLNGEAQLDIDFAPSLIQLNFPASDMVQMSAVAGGLLKNTGCANSEFVASLVTTPPTHLGNGLWLVSSDRSVLRTGMAFVSTANHCEYEGKNVKALIAFAACNDSHKPQLNTISHIVFEGKQNTLTEATADQLLALFKSNDIDSQPVADSDNSAVFVIKNAHGLHARPGAMLVAEAKKFESAIKVSNLDGDGSAVNAKSLMKVIALGVKKGHHLQFTAEGSDAKQALASIGAAIESGLGES